MKPEVVGFIFARGGSKGVPRKNIRPLAGKPLIAYAIEIARSSQWINRVIVSTDDEEIAGVARQFGAEIPFIRPPELALDDSPEWLSWRHAIQTISTERTIDVFVAIPTTSPLRAVEDVDSCIELLLKGDADIVVTVRSSGRSPYFNMVILNEGNYAQLVMPPAKAIYHRQDVPRVYDMTTVAYAALPGFILKANSMFEGKVRAVVVPPERAIDIDTELDLKIAEFLLSELSLKQE